MSMFTDEEVDPMFKKNATDSLPVTTRSTPKSGIMASSHRNDSTFTRHGEAAPANSVQLPQERTRDTDRLAKIISEVQEDAKLAKMSMEDLKTNFEEELDLLAESVSAFTSRISEVDALKLEVKTLKRRLQRLEQGNSSTRSSYTVNDLTEESTKQSRLAKVASMVGRKPKTTKSGAAASGRRPINAIKRAEEGLKSDAPDDASYRKLNSLQTSGVTKPPLRSFPATRVNQQAHRDMSSQSSSSDTEAYVSPIPATRPDVTKFQSPSSNSGTSAVALEFEQRPTKTPSAMSRKKPASAGSLKSRKLIPSSDMEDVDFEPKSSRNSKYPLGRGGLVPSRGIGRAGRPSNLGSRLPDPGWERLDWDGKPNTPWGRKRAIVRRGVSGGRMLSIRSEPKRRSSASLVEVTFAADGQRYDSIGRPLNEAGIPLRPDGRPDRRYLKKTIRDKSGILRYAADEPIPVENAALLDEALKIAEDEIDPTTKSALLDGALQIVADETGLTEQTDPPNEEVVSQIGLKRAHSEVRASIDDLDTRSVKRLRDDETDVMEEDIAELGRRWGIRQQSA